MEELTALVTAEKEFEHRDEYRLTELFALAGL